MLQESVFITPHDVAADMAEFIEQLGLDNCTYVFEMSNILGNTKELANKIWNLDKINNTYKEIIERIKNEYLNNQSGRVNKLNTRERENGKFIVSIREKYVASLLQDPFLPRELLPSDWKRYLACEMVKKL